ncbi:hypothetical protein HZB01_02160 [Candidatus Woesearchaeota archaeon]|nr:hypothetical protein [Candidatus Woesearchaeota archaeon]
MNAWKKTMKYVLFAIVLMYMFASVQAASASEDVVVSFTSNSGMETRNLYSGQVTLTVEGVGQSSALAFNDAFYIYTDQSGQQVDSFVLSPFLLGINGRPVTDYVSVPSYNSNHQYTFTVDLGSTPTLINFWVQDGYKVDNSGQFKVHIDGNSQRVRQNADFTVVSIGGDHNHRELTAGIDNLKRGSDPNAMAVYRVVWIVDGRRYEFPGQQPVNHEWGSAIGEQDLGITGPGTYHITVSVESVEGYNDINRGNNQFSKVVTIEDSVQIAQKADLVVTGIDMTPANPSVGQNVHFEANTKNYGNKVSGVVNIKWYMDGREIGYGSYGPHQPGSTLADYSDNIRLDWTATPGQHTLTFVIDSDSMEAESNENNNRLSKTFTVSGQYITPPPQIMGQGDFAVVSIGGDHNHRELTAGIDNLKRGSDPNAMAVYRVVWTVDGRRYEFPGQQPLNHEWGSMISESQLGITGPGTYQVTVSVSVDGYTDTNPSNNQFSKTVVIEDYINQPNTTVVSQKSDLSIVGGAYIAGQSGVVDTPASPAMLRLNMRSTGNGVNTEMRNVQVAINVNGNRQVRDIQVQLNPSVGQKLTDTFAFNFPAADLGITDLANTKYAITATIDSNFKVDELNENNNAYSFVVDKYSIQNNGDNPVQITQPPTLVSPPPFPADGGSSYSIALQSGWNLISLPSPLVRFLSSPQAVDSKRMLGFVYLTDQKKYVTLQEAQTILGDRFGSYLVTHAFWVYSYNPSSLNVQLDGRQMALESYSVEKGWNLAPILSTMVGKTLADVSGQCSVQRAYYWNAQTQAWEKMNGNLFTSNQANTGIVTNVKEACSFGSPKITLTPPAIPEDVIQETTTSNQFVGSNETGRACTKDVKVCFDGSTVVRNPKKNCEFFECPVQIKGDNQKLAENSAALNIRNNSNRFTK